MLKRSFFLILLALIAVSGPVMADTPIISAGTPDPARLETDPGGDYADIYARQLAYIEEDAKFRKLIEERQKNFVAPGLKVTADYRKNMRKYHGYKPEEDQAESTASESGNGEPFGPEFNP